MDTRTGKIYSQQEVREILGQRPDESQFFQLMVRQPTRSQLRRRPARVKRNEPCPCGSGRKFKKCCLWE